MPYKNNNFSSELYINDMKQSVFKQIFSIKLQTYFYGLIDLNLELFYNHYIWRFLYTCTDMLSGLPIFSTQGTKTETIRLVLILSRSTLTTKNFKFSSKIIV